MFGLTRAGGQRAGPGTYWSSSTGESVHLDEESALPGDEETTYSRLPPALTLFFGVLMSLVCLVFMPVIVLAALLFVVGQASFSGLKKWKAGVRARPEEKRVGNSPPRIGTGEPHTPSGRYAASEAHKHNH